MTSEPGRAGAVCARCGAVPPPGADRCPSCGTPFVPDPPSVNRYEAPKSPLAEDGTTAIGTLGRVVAYAFGVFLVLLSGVIAFTVTCFPIGLLSAGNNSAGGLILAFLVGLGAAGAALYQATKLFRRVMRRKGKATP